MKVAVILAEGFEETEAISVIDVLKRGGIDVNTFGLYSRKITGGHGIKVIADEIFSKTKILSHDAVFLPGGKTGVENLISDLLVIETIKEFNTKNKWIIAICAAPFILEKAGILHNKKATIYPTWKDKLQSISEYSEENIVIDNNIITSRGVGTALELSIKLLEIWMGSEVAENISKGILFS